ncbi:MAG TPA: ABC transporter permease [Thermoplasmata archaeon]|nr:ABC transporter permease [Thermoplasmata archaeon]
MNEIAFLASRPAARSPIPARLTALPHPGCPATFIDAQGYPSHRGGGILRPILRLASRLTPRTRTTAWAIALASMVLVGSLSLVDGLRAGSESVLSRIRVEPAVYIAGTDLLASRIDPAALAPLGLDVDVFRIHAADLEVNGLSLPVIVASLTHLEGVNATTPYPLGTQDLSLDSGLRDTILTETGAPLASTGTLSVLGTRLAGLPIVDPPPGKDAFLPDDWAYARPELFATANASEGPFVQAIVAAHGLDSSMVAALGLTPFDLVGAVGFTQGSVDEVGSALIALSVVIAAVISVLVYFAMSLEVVQRSREIRTLRSLGASPRLVASLYEGQALLLALVGATVGSALGIVLAHGFVSFASLVGLPNLLVLAPPTGGVALAFGVAVLASALGALVPARRAGLLVRGVPEAVSS